MIEYSGISNSVWFSKPIHLQSFFCAFSSNLPVNVPNIDKPNCRFTTSDMRKVMEKDLTKKQINELKDYCTAEKLTVTGEPPMLDTKCVSRIHKYFSRSIEMCSESELETSKRILKGTHSERHQFLKYKDTAFLANECETVPPTEEEECCETNKELLITIRVHSSYPCTADLNAPVRPMSQEICVLGSQTLEMLRDKIFCPLDYTTASKKSATLSDRTTNPVRAKDIFKSGFIFIEDVFYNDLRSEDNSDYSAGILAWAKSKKNIGPMKTGCLVSTKFLDLTIRFGFPYVFVHQGNCEHLLLFSDVSLIHQTDVKNTTKYPLFKSLGKMEQQLCLICSNSLARWITFENPRVPINPFYFCDTCFKSYNFIDGEQISEFKYYEIFPYMPVHLFTDD